MYIIPSEENKQFQEALQSIRNIVQYHGENELFYDYLISVAPTIEEKKILSSIKDDKHKHTILFINMYKDFTGIELPTVTEKNITKANSYLHDIQKALFEELNSVKKCREIREAFSIKMYRDILFNIITDKISHSSKLNYLYMLGNK